MRWNWSSSASLEGVRSYEGQSNSNPLEKKSCTKFSISIKSSWPCKLNHPNVMPVSILRVCWNRSSIASLAHERPDEGRRSKNQTEKQYLRFIVSIQSSGAHKFDYLIAMPVSISKMGWNWSSTASLEGKIIDEGRKWRFSLSCYLYYAFSFVWLFYSMQRREY